MLSSDLINAAKTLLSNLRDLRPELEKLNYSFLEAMDQENSADAVRGLFPMLIETSDKTAAVMGEAFLSVNWELPDNDPKVLYAILAGECSDIPEDLKAEVVEHLSSLSGVEKMMTDRFGADPITSCLESLGLLEELSETIASRDEVQSLLAALKDTPGLPLVTQE